MKYRELIAEAIREAEGFSKHATIEQKNRLRMGFPNDFNPNAHPKCWYGLATGNCYNESARRLLNKVNPTFVKAQLRSDVTKKAQLYSAAKGKCKLTNNGADRWLTSLEWYILIVNKETVRRNLLKIALS